MDRGRGEVKIMRAGDIARSFDVVLRNYSLKTQFV
jgi:hypothetical protein